MLFPGLRVPRTVDLDRPSHARIRVVTASHIGARPTCNKDGSGKDRSTVRGQSSEIVFDVRHRQGFGQERSDIRFRRQSGFLDVIAGVTPQPKPVLPDAHLFPARWAGRCRIPAATASGPCLDLTGASSALSVDRFVVGAHSRRYSSAISQHWP